MECIYINLDDQPDRRDALEGAFRQYSRDGWRLNRLAATPAGLMSGTQGTLRDAEKACFDSHRQAVETALNLSGHTLILEDDVLIGPNSFAHIDSVLQSLPEDRWDLIFTDICLGSIEEMLHFLCLRRKLEARGTLKLMDLEKINFSGTAAYIVNRRSKEKFLGLLKAHDPLEVPYDLYLRQMVHQHRIKALVAFPFLTSLSAEADASQVQADTSAVNDLATNAFRKMMWIHRSSLQEALGPIDRLIARQPMDPELQGALAVIYALVGNQLGIFRPPAGDAND